MTEHTFSWTENQLLAKMAVHTFPPLAHQRPIRLPHYSHTHTTHPHTSTRWRRILKLRKQLSPALAVLLGSPQVPYLCRKDGEDKEEDDAGNWNHHSYMRIKPEKEAYKTSTGPARKHHICWSHSICQWLHTSYSRRAEAADTGSWRGVRVHALLIKNPRHSHNRFQLAYCQDTPSHREEHCSVQASVDRGQCGCWETAPCGSV